MKKNQTVGVFSGGFRVGVLGGFDVGFGGTEGQLPLLLGRAEPDEHGGDDDDQREDAQHDVAHAPAGRCDDGGDDRREDCGADGHEAHHNAHGQAVLIFEPAVDHHGADQLRGEHRAERHDAGQRVEAPHRVDQRQRGEAARLDGDGDHGDDADVELVEQTTRERAPEHSDQCRDGRHHCHFAHANVHVGADGLEEQAHAAVDAAAAQTHHQQNADEDEPCEVDPLLFGCSGSHVYLLCAFGRRDRPRSVTILSDRCLLQTMLRPGRPTAVLVKIDVQLSDAEPCPRLSRRLPGGGMRNLTTDR